MADTSTVTITIVGVREDQLPRLKTVIKGELTRFGSSVRVDDGQPPAPEKSRRGR